MEALWQSGLTLEMLGAHYPMCRVLLDEWDEMTGQLSVRISNRLIDQMRG